MDRLFALISPTQLRRIRKKLGFNQAEFWEIVGVTQSGGSRYENGREMPKPVRALVRIRHVWELSPHTLCFAGNLAKTESVISALAFGSKTLKLIRSGKNKRRTVL